MVQAHSKRVKKPRGTFTPECRTGHPRKLLSWLVAHSIANPNYARSVEFRKIIKAMRLSEAVSVLSVGCGVGEDLHYLLAHDQSISPVGVDVEIRELRTGNRRCNAIHFVAASAEDLPFKDSVFDRVLSSSALEHFEDPTSALKEVNRCLSSNGLLVLTTDSWKWERLGEWKDRHATVASVKHYYTLELLQSSLISAGLFGTYFEYLLTTRMAPYLLRMGVKYRYEGKVYLLISMLGILLDNILGRFFKENDGFTILSTAKKR